MSHRLDKCFETLRKNGRKALVGYLTGGDPDFDASLHILETACRSGIDVLELGVPFSDPTSDGPVIQAASARALASGMNLEGCLRLAGALREKIDTPIVLFSYYNPVLRYGADPFYKAALAAGVDGLLLVDLPPEESEELTGEWADPRRLPLIRLVAPTTGPERLRKICRGAGGFLYLITRTGVTGEGGVDKAAVAEQAARVRAVSSLPLCAGFGVRNASDAAAMAPSVDGVVVGSALVRQVSRGGPPEAAAARVAESVARLRTGLDGRGDGSLSG